MSIRNRRTVFKDVQGRMELAKANYRVTGYRGMPDAVVVGSGIFKVAMSFTEEGHCALLVAADTPGGGVRTIIGLRQRQDGYLEYFRPPAFDVLNAEHPFISRICRAWLAGGERKKDNHAGNVLADTNVIAE